jgi:Transposase DDE domain
MDGQLLAWLYRRLLRDPILGHTRDCTYSDGLILFLYFYGVIFNRSARWAVDKRNWPLAYRRLDFPSYSQLCIRLKRASVSQVIRQIDAELQERLPSSNLKFIDGKPLTISGFSKDPDATFGHATGGPACGYKLHALVDSLGKIERSQVAPLHASEKTVMRQMLQNQSLSKAIVRADANYDANHLYERIAHCGGRLLANRRKPFVGIGYHDHHPDRLRAIAELERSPKSLRQHQSIRSAVERHFGHLTTLPCGLWALPGFVRRLHRVQQWVNAKIVLYHLHLLLRQEASHAA